MGPRHRITQAAIVACVLAGCSAAPGAQGDAGARASDPQHGDIVDFGRFCEIIENGGIPGPATLDEVDYLARHRLSPPEPACPRELCPAALVGERSGTEIAPDRTALIVGLGASAAAAGRVPMARDLVIAIDTSASMEGANLEHVRRALLNALDGLAPEDRVTLVTFSDSAAIETEHVAPSSAELEAAITNLEAGGKTNLYDGVRVAFESIARHAEPDRLSRVVLLSDGVATTGIATTTRIVEMARQYASLGFGLSTLGLGDEFDVELLRTLSELGGGAFHFVADIGEVGEALGTEIGASMIPVAADVHLSFDLDSGYEVVRVRGTRLASGSASAGSVHLPNFQVCLADDRPCAVAELGHRAFVAELRRQGADAGSGQSTVGSLTVEYRAPGEGDYATASVDIPVVDAGQKAGGEQTLATATADKGLVLLDLLVGFETASIRAAQGDNDGAAAVLLELEDQVEEWLEHHDDADVADDLRYVRLFVDNLRDRAAEPSASDGTPEPGPSG